MNNWQDARSDSVEEPAIQTSDLTQAYGTLTAIDHINGGGFIVLVAMASKLYPTLIQ